MVSAMSRLVNLETDRITRPESNKNNHPAPETKRCTCPPALIELASPDISKSRSTNLHSFFWKQVVQHCQQQHKKCVCSVSVSMLFVASLAVSFFVVGGIGAQREKLLQRQDRHRVHRLRCPKKQLEQAVQHYLLIAVVEYWLL